VFPNLPTWMIPQKWRDSRGLTIEAKDWRELFACMLIVSIICLL